MSVLDWLVVDLDLLLNLIPDKALGSPGLPVVLGHAPLTLPVNFEVQAFTVALELGAELKIESFNSADDADDLGVVGAAPDPLDPRAVSSLPAGGGPWIKYSAQARAKAQVGMPASSFLAASATGESLVRLADYQLHAPTENARQAVHDDLHGKKLRYAFRAGDLAKLQPGEAMALQTTGKLTVQVEVKWADVFSTNLGVLSDLLAGDSPLALQTSLGASLSAAVTLSDAFVLVFSRPAAGRVRVALFKGATHQLDAVAKLGVEVALDKPELVPEQVGAVMDALVGGDSTRVEAQINRIATLGAAEKETLHQVLARLRLVHLENTPAPLQDAWQLLKGSVQKKVAELAATKLSNGFKYEYLRVSRDSAVLQLVMSDADAARLHGDIVNGRLTNLMAAAKASPESFQVERFLRQSTFDRTESWGFSLGLGAYTLTGQDTRKLSRVVTTDETQQRKRIAYLGVRQYAGSLFDLSKGAWSADFKCDMDQLLPAPDASSFSYGLHLMIQRDERLPSDRDLRAAIDEAAGWRAVREADADLVYSQIKAAAGGKALSTRLELKLSDAMLRALVPLIAAGDPLAFAQALGRAMPWDSMPARALPSTRASLYGPLWAGVLRDRGWSPADAARTASSHLAKTPPGDGISYREGQLQAAAEWSFAELIQKNPGCFDKWRDFVDGAAQLRDAIAHRGPAETVEAVFPKLQELWGLSFYVKAVGALLVSLAAGTPEGLKGLERTFTVSLLGKDAPSQLLFSTTGAP